MTRLIRSPIVLVALPLLLASCAKVSFWGDSELLVSKPDVVAAQSVPDDSTLVYANPGCGLMPTTSTACHAGTTQKAVDAYWRSTIKTDDAAGAPAYIEVELGINDAFFHSSRELVGYKLRIERFVRWLPAGVPVLWDNIPAMAPPLDPTLDQNSQIVNAALVSAAAETPSLHIVDLRTPFAGHWPAWFSSDELHYNSAGQYEFALLNCHALDAISAAHDGPHDGIGAACDPLQAAAAAGTSPQRMH